jgi:hypothetical protein
MPQNQLSRVLAGAGLSPTAALDEQLAAFAAPVL